MTVKNPSIMRVSRNLILSIGLIALLLSPIAVLAQSDAARGKDMKVDKGSKKVVLSSDGFQIEVNAGGQVPFYHFNTSASKFFLKFQKILQFKDSNSNGLYDRGEEISAKILSLPSISWDLTVISDTNDSKDFSFNSSQIRQSGYEGAELALVNHFDGNDPAVKFDVFISNWPFDADATGLAMEFELIWNEDANLVKETTDTAIELKDSNGVVHARFGIVSDITVDGTEMPDGAHLVDTAGDNASKLNIYISYPRFNSTLVHDPTISSTRLALEDTNPAAMLEPLFGNVDVRNAIGGFVVLTVLGSLAVLSLVWINKKKK